jgi:outer membrane biosynthesis protein TonB
MSLSNRQQADQRGIDLGTGVDRRLLIGAAALVLLVLTGAALLFMLARPQAAAENDAATAQRAALLSRERANRLPALFEPQSPPRETPRQETPVEVATKPAAPETPKPEVVAEKPVPAPPVPVATPAPAPPEPEKVVKTPEPPSFKRRQLYSEPYLRVRLAEDSREVDVEAEKETTKKLLSEAKDAPTERAEAVGAASKDDPKPKGPAILDLVAQRADLKGLPIRNLNECQASEKEAKIMQELSREARKATDSLRCKTDSDNSSHGALECDKQVAEYVRKKTTSTDWGEDVGVRALVQMFMAEGSAVRIQVIKTLAGTKGKAAGTALAQCAVFDLNADVRKAAIDELKDRPRSEYRPALLEALRYPWPPVADHAAEAIVALKDREAAPDLVRLLDDSDPRAPTQDKQGEWVMPQIVRINHLANCVLCHAPSRDKQDFMRASVPERGKPVRPAYGESKSGILIRADVTYLRQDFSLIHLVPEPDKWPRRQRFDYLVRIRELTADEVSRLTATKDRDAEDPATYPQRRAVLWALCELTGKDLGLRSDDWQAYVKDARIKSDP